MRKLTSSLLALVCMQLSCLAIAGEVIGNTYIGERFGYIELNSLDGKWEINDKERNATNDLAGMVAHFKLKEAVSGWKPDVNITAFKGVAIDFVINSMRESWSGQGFENLQTETGRIAGRKVFQFDMQGTLKGTSVRGRNIFLESEKAVFAIQMMVPAHVFSQMLPLLEELAATAKY